MLFLFTFIITVMNPTPHLTASWLPINYVNAAGFSNTNDLNTTFKGTCDVMNVKIEYNLLTYAIHSNNKFT